MKLRTDFVVGVAVAIFLHLTPASAQLAAAAPDSLYWLDLNQLSRVHVVSVSRTDEILKNVAAPVFVLSSDQIKRSGATSIPEALRLCPGVEVSRINANRYSISIRGFGGEYSNKLLVLMDGRSVFTPQFSGVFWDMQEMLLDDIDRIEVVRGPGGTTWGANALNGVINIVTKHASQTQGILASLSTGTFEGWNLGVRYGSALNETIEWRASIQTSAHGASAQANGEKWVDDWNSHAGNVRMDAAFSNRDKVMMMAGVTYSEPVQYSSGKAQRFRSAGAHVVSQWTHQFRNGSTLDAKAYYDVVRRAMLQNAVNTDVFDSDLRVRTDVEGAGQIQTGLGYRFIQSRPSNTPQHIFNPTERHLQLANIFLEDQMQLFGDRVMVFGGIKAEYHELSGWHTLPSARVRWTITPTDVIWGSVSKGLRTPGIDTYDLTINTPFYISLPNPDIKLEQVVAHQAGYRGSVGNTVEFDVAVFSHTYSNLTTVENLGGTPPASMLKNNLFGTTLGGEGTVTVDILDRWRWRTTYSYADHDLKVSAGSTDLPAPSRSFRYPMHQLLIWWSFQPVKAFDFDVMWKYVDPVPISKIPAYRRLDLHVTSRLFDPLLVSIAGDNLLDARHPESGRSPGFPGTSEVPRSVTATVSVQFR